MSGVSIIAHQSKLRCFQRQLTLCLLTAGMATAQRQARSLVKASRCRSSFLWRRLSRICLQQVHLPRSVSCIPLNPASPPATISL